MDIYKETIAILKKYKLQANKALGQNFLIDEEVINTIIEESEINKNDLVIEIGPGLGVLTKRLLEKAYKVIAVELDENMVRIIKDRFEGTNNLTVLNEDILKVNLKQLIDNERSEAIRNNENIKNVKIVANLPYYISSPIVIKLLQEKSNIDSITIMVQKEVAERIIAVPGNKLSGSITYIVNYYSEGEKILDVSKHSFVPEPKVESQVIKLNIRKSPKIEIKDEKNFFDFIQLVFSQRRKTLANALVNFNIVNNKSEAIELIEKAGFNVNVRAESLSLEQFAKLEKVLDF